MVTSSTCADTNYNLKTHLHHIDVMCSHLWTECINKIKDALQAHLLINCSNLSQMSLLKLSVLKLVHLSHFQLCKILHLPLLLFKPLDLHPTIQIGQFILIPTISRPSSLLFFFIPSASPLVLPHTPQKHSSSCHLVGASSDW